MKHKLRYGKNMSNNTVLCVTSNEMAGRKTAKLLVDKSIAFTQNWRWIPPMYRKRYNGANRICVITVHPNAYSQARRALDDLNPRYYSRVRIRRYS